MAKKRGRKKLYESKVKPFLKDIEKWSKQGLTEKQIAQKLGVAYSSYNLYKTENIEISEARKKGLEVAVSEIENAMFESAKGGKQKVQKTAKLKKIIYEDGKKVEEYEYLETYEEEVYNPPNTTAGIYLLKHWGKDRGYVNNPVEIDIKKEELELKKEELKLKKEMNEF